MAHTSGNTLIGTSTMLTSLGVAAGSQLGGAGLSIAEVASALVRGTQDLGQLAGDQTAAGVRVNAINKWAKYKPVRKANMWGQQGEWWKADDGKCGIGVTTYEQLSDMVTQIRNQASGLIWAYNPPRGIRTGYSAEPYRLLDFNGYYKNAEFPMPYLNGGAELTIVNHDATHSTIYTVPTRDALTAACSLGFTDIYPEGVVDPNLGDYYVGMVLQNIGAGESNKWCVATGSALIKNLTAGVWNGMTIYGLDQCTSAAKAYSEFRTIPFFSSVQLTEEFNQATSDDIQGAFISANDNTGVMLYVHISGKLDLSISHNCTWIASDPRVVGTVTLAVTTGPIQDATLHNVQINIVEKNNHSVVINGQNYGTKVLYCGSDERAEGTITIAIWASEDSEGFDPNTEYVLSLYCDELLSTIYSTETITIRT